MNDRENNNISTNPFAALFGSVADAERFSAKQGQQHGDKIEDESPTEGFTESSSSSRSESADEETEDSVEACKRDFRNQQETCVHLNLNHMIQRVFLITLDSEPSTRNSNGIPPCCVYLQETVAQPDAQDWLDMDNLEQALFTRLLLVDPDRHVVSMTAGQANFSAERDAGEHSVLHYLLACYRRAKIELAKVPEHLLGSVVQCRNLCVSNARTSLLTPEIYPDTDTHAQLLELLADSASVTPGGELGEGAEFMQAVLSAMVTEGDSLEDAFWPALDVLRGQLETTRLEGPALPRCLAALSAWVAHPEMAKVLMRHVAVADGQQGAQYDGTILGAVLRPSCLPLSPFAPPGPSGVGQQPYFSNPTRIGPHELHMQETNIHQLMSHLQEQMSLVLRTLMQNPETRHELLSWLAGCLSANAGRRKLWASQMPALFHQGFSSDGMLLNLGGVLARLCRPFCRPHSPKLLGFDPTYCAAGSLEPTARAARGVHMAGLEKETCLVPSDPGETANLAESYNLLTEMLVMAQLTLSIGFHRMHGELVNLNRALHQLRAAWQDATTVGSPAAAGLQERFEHATSAYLSLKAALTEPQALGHSLAVQAATAELCVQYALGEGRPGEYLQVQFADENDAEGSAGLVGSLLKHTPEFLVDNLADLLIFLRRFSEATLEETGDSLQDFLNLITLFMGSTHRMRNPHLRARLAEVLEAVMPRVEEATPPSGPPVPTLRREQAFTTYPHAARLACALLNVFVDIEFTGDPHHFEQKFNYRRPMYPILRYMWGQDDYRASIKDLANQALQNIDATNAPLFLRFLNLLLNDAIFLLDEAIQYLSRIKVLQLERERGEWDGDEPAARRERENSLNMFGQLARFHNIMSNETIRTLAFLTQDIKALFVNPVLCDRVIAMLNHFLQHLAGPRMGALKVKDFSEFDFRPHQLVSDICTIYLNLGEKEAFCAAVPRDGRSYSPTLFAQTVRVLTRINKPSDMITAFVNLADKVKSLADQHQQEEETYADAPDEFLDPIMSTLMQDPVVLPSSRVTLDRCTIARHLLSDHTDPFNRSPLTMEQVKPDTELRDRIQEWLQQRRQQQQQQQQEQQQQEQQQEEQQQEEQQPSGTC
ncbi:ubiquitin conjugation factor E4 A isoform X2 [Lampetra fluviatilis]